MSPASAYTERVPIPSQVVSDAAVADPVPVAKPTPKPRVEKASRTTARQPQPDWIQQFAQCVISHESRHAGMYTAENPYSSASGAYQFIDSTWRSASRAAGYPGYARAKYAPPAVQDAVFAYVVAHGGALHWRGTHCGYGT